MNSKDDSDERFDYVCTWYILKCYLSRSLGNECRQWWNRSPVNYAHEYKQSQVSFKTFIIIIIDTSFARIIMSLN